MTLHVFFPCTDNDIITATGFYSSYGTDICFGKGSVGKQRVASKEFCVVYR